MHSLRARLILICLALVFLPLIGIGLYGRFFTTQALSDHALERSMQEVHLQASHIVNGLDQTYGDLLYLGRLRSLQTLKRLQEQNAPAEQIDRWHNEVAQDLLMLASVRPMYYRLRYVDATGKEVARIETNERNVTIAPAETLQDLSGTPAMQHILRLPDEGVYVSSFEIDRDNMDDETPIVQFGLQLGGGDGIIMIDLRVVWLVRDLPAADGVDVWALVDQDGEYLVFPEAYARLDMARLTPLLRSETGSGSLETETSVLVYNRINPSAAVSNRFWVIYRETPKNVLYADVTDFFQTASIFLLAAVLSAFAAAFLASHFMLTPILDLSEKVRAFGRGEPLPQVPPRYPTNEIGALNRSFYEMAQELEKKRAEQRNLIERLINAQEEERKLVAYDLHDGLIQQLVGARLHLTSCRAHCPVESHQAQQGLLLGCDAVTEAIQEGRRIIEGLHPAILDDLGLCEALADMARATAQTVDWELELDLHGLDFEPDRHTSVTLYRIAQEGLNNIRKHAQAKHIRLSIANGDGIALEIEDDGLGFDVTSLPDSHKGFGITTMQERARLIGGTCAIKSTPGQGTRISIWVPAVEKEEQ